MRHVIRSCTNCHEQITYRVKYRIVVTTLLMENTSFHTCHLLCNATTRQNSLISEIDKYVPQTFTSVAQIARRLPVSILSTLSTSEHESYIENNDNKSSSKSTSCVQNTIDCRKLSNTNRSNNTTESGNCNNTTCSEELASTERVLQSEKSEPIVAHKATITHDNKDKGGLYAFLTFHQNEYEVTQIGKVAVARKRSEREKELLKRQNTWDNPVYSSSSSCNTVTNSSYDEVSLNTPTSFLSNQQRFAPLEVYHLFTTFTIPARVMWEQSDKDAKSNNANESYEESEKTTHVSILSNKTDECTFENTSDRITKGDVVNLISKYDKWLDYRNLFINKANYTLERFIVHGYVRIRPRFQFSNLTESAQKQLLAADNVKSKQALAIDSSNDNEETSNNISSNSEGNNTCDNANRTIFTPDMQFATYRVEEYEIYRLARLIPRLCVDVPLSADRMAVARNLLPPNRDPVHVFMSAPELYRVTTETPAPTSTPSRKKGILHKNVKYAENSSISCSNNNDSQSNTANSKSDVNSDVRLIRRTRKLSIIEALTKEHKTKMRDVNSTNSVEYNNTIDKNDNSEADNFIVENFSQEEQSDETNVATEIDTSNSAVETDNTSVTDNASNADNNNTMEDSCSVDECHEEHHDLLYVRFLLDHRFVPHHQSSRATLQRQLDEILAQSRNKQGVTFPVDRAKRRGIERCIQFIDNPSPFFHHRVLAQYIFDLLPVNAAVRFSDLMRRLPLEVKLCIPPESIRILKSFPELFRFDSTTSDQIIRRADCDDAFSHTHYRSSSRGATSFPSHAQQHYVKISNEDVIMHIYNHYTSLRHPELGTNIFRYYSLMPKVMQLYLLRLHDVESELLLQCPDKIEIITDQIIVVRTQTDLAKYELESNVATEYQLRSCKGRRDFFVAFRFKGEWQQKLIKRFQWHCKKYGYDPYTTRIITRSD